MKIVSNYKRIDIKIIFKKIIKKFFYKKKSIIFIFIFSNLFILIFFYTNLKRIKKDYWDVKQIDLKDLIVYLKEIATSYDFEKKIQRVDINLNYKNIILLDCLRQKRKNYRDRSFDALNNDSSSNKECDANSWAKGTLIHNNINYPIKLKAKGDRNIHLENFKKMSFKVDIKGEKRYMGMEEFSIQRPIIRNYTSELLTAKLMQEIGVSSPRHHYIRLFINGEYLGLRHIEEGFSRELIEASKKRYGPIFSLQEEVSTYFGKTRFDLADLKQWKIKNELLASDALSILELAQREPKLIKKYFDQKLWAKYFALIDILYSYHGVIPKSVKFYLNPTTGLFEPAFYDGHKGVGLFKNFLLVDFTKVNREEIECDWICDQDLWFNSFFIDGDNLDKNFYTYYLNALKKYSSKDFEINKIELFKKELSPLRGALYRELTRRDHVFSEGSLPHIEKHALLRERLKKIRFKINKAENDSPYFSFDGVNNILSITNQSSDLPQVFNLFCKEKLSKPMLLRKHDPIFIKLDFFNDCSKDDFYYSLDNFKSKRNLFSNLIGNFEFEKQLLDLSKESNINKKKSNLNLNQKELLISKNLHWDNKNIYIKNDIKFCLMDSAILSINNSRLFNLGKNKISFISCNKGSGSVIISNSDVNLHNIEIAGLKAPIKRLTSLYGGLNLINSNLNAVGLSISSSLSEDGVNFIDSDIKLNLITADYIQSDAIDSDASILNISEIKCNTVKNDCLDLSYSSAKVNKLFAKKIGDKVISAGESSILELNKVIALNSEMGIVAKDSSNILVKSYKAENVSLPIAAYIKKAELGPPFIEIALLEKKLFDNNLISSDSSVFLGGEKVQGVLDSKEISNMLYGNLYGVKTLR